MASMSGFVMLWVRQVVVSRRDTGLLRWAEANARLRHAVQNSDG